MQLQDIKDYIVNNTQDNEYTLVPIYDSKKFFYNKAIVKIYGNIKVLYSYDTPVCYIYDCCKYTKYFLNYDIQESLLFSNTTLRHIKEFLQQDISIQLALSNTIGGKITKNDIIKNDGKEF